MMNGGAAPEGDAGLDDVADSPDRPDESVALQATAAQVRAALAASPASLVFGILASLLVAVVVDLFGGESDVRDRVARWIWWLLLCLTFGIAFVACRRFNESKATAQEVIDTVLRGPMWWSIFVSGAFAIGSTSWVFLPNADPRIDMFVSVYMFAMIAGEAGTHGSYPPLTLRCLVPAVVVFVLGLWRLGDRFYALVGVGFVVMAVSTYFYTSTQARLARTIFFLERQANQERQQAEAARRAADRANQAKTMFLAVVGHDLRQPLHAMVQYQGQLRRKNHDPELSGTIERFGTSLDAMRDLLNSILEVSKLMTGAITPHFGPVELGTVLDRIDAQVRPLAADKSLRFDIRHANGCVISDEILLERIIRNLILNAIRYTEKGTVGIHTKQQGGQLILRVFDTGAGIARNHRDQIFEDFFQVGNVARNADRGFGLGLGIVKGLARLLSVQVSLRSKPLRGSIFRLTMPLAESRPAIEAAPEDSQRDYARGAIVLLIEDDARSLHATTATLSDFGCRVIPATSAMDAVGRLQGQELVPDLIVSDYRLEDATGLEAIDLVRADQNALLGETFEIRALLITGDTAPAELDKVRAAGLQMLHKPVSPEVLYAAVNAELRSLALADT